MKKSTRTGVIGKFYANHLHKNKLYNKTIRVAAKHLVTAATATERGRAATQNSAVVMLTPAQSLVARFMRGRDATHAT